MTMSLLSARRFFHHPAGVARAALLCLAAALLGACGTLPAPRPATPETRATAPDVSSPLARTAAASMPPDGQSGLRLLPLGVYSLDARLELARRARRTLDVQYYVIADDGSGRLLLRTLKEAAGRGVRVRLLVDDLYTASTGPLLAGLAATPNVEVRLFNPFCCARGSLAGRFAASAFDLRRLNHRMHNKLFVADGALAIMGGRNIADEYFTLNPARNFIDMDALLAGPVVGQLGTIFDIYWNSPQAWPLAQIEPPRADAATLSRAFDKRVGMDRPPDRVVLPAVDVLGYAPIGAELDAGRLRLLWGEAGAVADPPAKLDFMTDEQALADSVTMRFWSRLLLAEREVVMTSPYLVPGERGMAAFELLRRRDIALTLLTNSLAASDEPLVHTGYMRYRVRMLRDGIDLYELSPARVKRNKRFSVPGLSGSSGSSVGRLHAKTAVIDGRWAFVGSANLDPRSATQNTELGVMIDSPPVAQQLLRLTDINKVENAYRLRLDARTDAVEWLASDGEREVVLHSEPESSWLQRLSDALLSPFVPEHLL